MEIRKFIVEIHPDGRVYATEYEEPGEFHYTSDYDRYDIRDALHKLDIDCCCEIANAYRAEEKYAVDALERVETLIYQVRNTYWK